MRAEASDARLLAGLGRRVTRRSVLLGGGGAAVTLVLPLPPGMSPAPPAMPSVLTTEAYAKLGEDGLVSDVPIVDGLAAVMVAAGGAAWAWRKPETDLALDVVQLTIEPAARGAWTSELQRARFDPRDADSPDDFVSRDAKATGLRPVAVFRRGTLTLVSVPYFAKWVA